MRMEDVRCGWCDEKPKEKLLYDKTRGLWLCEICAEEAELGESGSNGPVGFYF